MRISQKGINLIKEFEGCILQSYDDYNDRIVNAGDNVRGTLTIGYGHIEGVYKGQVISQEEADKMLIDDMVRYSNQVQEVIDEGTISFPVNQNQFDALTSFDYNCGQGSLRTLCRNRDAGTVADMLLEYRNKGSQWEAGLLRRRQAERALFLDGDCDSVPVDTPAVNINEKVLTLQQIFNRNGFRDYNGNPLVEDGKWGEKTESACPLVNIPWIGEVVTWIQLRVGVDPDSKYGNDTKQAVIGFQESHGLTADGIVGKNTFKAMALC